MISRSAAVVLARGRSSGNWTGMKRHEAGERGDPRATFCSRIGDTCCPGLTFPSEIHHRAGQCLGAPSLGLGGIQYRICRTPWSSENDQCSAVALCGEWFLVNDSAELKWVACCQGVSSSSLRFPWRLADLHKSRSCPELLRRRTRRRPPQEQGRHPEYRRALLRRPLLRQGPHPPHS